MVAATAYHGHRAGRLMRALLVVTMLWLAGCASDPAPQPTPAAPMPAVDLRASGPESFASQTWSNAVDVAMGNTGVYPVELRGTMHVPDGEGPWPVLVFMHGRHSTCRYADMTEFFAPGVCPDAPPAMAPVRNAHGYDYLGAFLASHGFVVVSVNANNVNDNDLTWSVVGDDSGATARGQIIGRVLRDLSTAHGGADVADWPDLSGRLDLQRVGLMGHSRGGEGVVAATHLIATGDVDPGAARVRAVFSLAPTDFARWSIRDVAFATLLPYCDGDVTNLQGAWMFDDNRFGTHDGFWQYTVTGANHNFYNTVWTNDDFGNRGDPWCDRDEAGGGRLAPEAQQANGVEVMATWFRAVLTEPALLPATQAPRGFDGTWTSHHPPGAVDRTGFFDAADGIGGFGAATCTGAGCPGQIAFPMATQRLLEWGSDVAVPVPDDVVSARFNVLPGEDVADLVRIETPDGSWSLRDLGVLVPPGDDWARNTLNQVDLPAGSQRRLVFTGEGRLLTADWLA